MSAGLRVVRGPNWVYGNDDGGEGHVGTVIEVHDGHQRATVLWDNGSEHVYRIGLDNAFDLRVFDSAQLDIQHFSVTCDDCREMPIKGLRWKCAVCPDFDLCSSCYNLDKHDTSHPFVRYDIYTATHKIGIAKVNARAISKREKIKAMGIFPNAKVIRGKHWAWADQDGGPGQTGLVQNLKDYKSCFRSIVEVTWSSGSCNEYRLGYCGQVDLKCVEAAPGGYYYRNHLPVFGQCIISPRKFQEGDFVRCVFGVDKLKELNKDHGGWTESMRECTKKTGVVADLSYDRVRVKYATSQDRWFNQDVLGKVPSDEDTVTIAPGLRVVRGPDWCWGDQDGGEGHVGTVVENIKPDDEWISVIWDNGSENTYRAGFESAFELRVLDSGQSGIKHEHIQCDSCHVSPIKGIRWTCALCFNFDLCSDCYHGNKHDLTHPFRRYDNHTSKRYQVPSRINSCQTECKGIFKGAKVVRGKHWQCQDEDGTVDAESLDQDQEWISVTWDNSSDNTYRAKKESSNKQSTINIGRSGTVDAESLDQDQEWISVTWDNSSDNTYRAKKESSNKQSTINIGRSGVKHDGVMCDSCKVCPIKGIRWKCARCFNFDLCSVCYHGNKHDSTHSFWRYDNGQNKRFQIPWRDKETFRDPIYVPGKQSEEGDAEEVTLACGTVLTIKPWDDDTSNSAATVKWDNGITNTYRLGWHGKVDLKFKTAASGGHFYISHLPMLGKMEVTPCQFEPGDAVICRYDTRQVKVLQVNHGGWNPQMPQYLQQNGKVLEIDGDGDVLVEYFDGAAWWFNPDALCRSKDLKNFTRSPMDSNAVSTVLELGLDTDLVKKVVWRDFFNSQTCFTDTELLLNAILDEPNTQNTHLAPENLNVRTDTDSENNSYTSSGNDRDSATFSELERETNPIPNLTCSTLVAAKESAATVDNDQTLAEKYRQLMEERQCKICMEAEARMTFVPCGHLVSCEDCSSQLKQCPMCRSDIEKVVKTFLL